MTELALLSDPVELAEQQGDPGQYVIAACEQARGWLTRTLVFDDVHQTMELRAQGEAIAVYARQRDLGDQAQLAAAEVVRRAERGVAVATAHGQRAGLVLTGGRPPGNPSEPEGFSRTTDFLGPYGSRYDETRKIGAIPDDDFEEIVEEGKAEGNLTRSNLLNKAKARGEGRPSTPPPAPVAPPPVIDLNVGLPTCNGFSVRPDVLESMAAVEQQLRDLCENLTPDEDHLLIRMLGRITEQLHAKGRPS